MVSRVKNNIIETKIILFFIIICLLIIPLQSFKYFRAYNLLSNYILLITDEGIAIYDPQLNQHRILTESNLINGASDIDFISFAQSPSEEGGYIFCRLKNYIFIYDESFNSYGKFEIEPASIYCVLNPYRTKDGNNAIIVTYINGNQKIDTSMYIIDLNNADNPGSLYKKNNSINVLDSERGEQQALNKGISCELMYSSIYTNKLLTCFALDIYSYSMNAIVIDPENSLNVLHYSQNLIKTAGSSNINSELSPNQKDSIICYLDANTYFWCLKYDLESNKFGDFIPMDIKCQLYPFNMDIKYIKARHEYSAFCNINYITIAFITFDENYINKCNTSFSIQIDGVYNFHSTRLLYVKYLNYYYMLLSYIINNGDFFDILKIESCNFEINDTSLNQHTEDIPELSSSTPIPSTSPTSSTSIIKEVTTIPTSLLSSTTIKKENLAIPSSLLSSSSAIKESSSILITSKVINKDSTLTTTFSLSSTTIKKTVLNSLTNALNLEKKSSTIISSSTPIGHTIQKTIIKRSQYQSVLKSEIHSKISSFPSSFFASHNILLKSSLITSSSPNTNISESKNHINISFHLDGDINKGKIDKNKEEIEDNLKEIMEIIEIGKKYEINGNDYNMTITPIKDLNAVKSTYVDISLCEQILRKEYKIPQDDILTILQIEIDKKNQKALTSQVEYAIYNKKKVKLELSFCKDVQIKVNYEIKNQSALNKTMIDYYSNLGIDIFNSKGSFFIFLF